MASGYLSVRKRGAGLVLIVSRLPVPVRVKIPFLPPITFFRREATADGVVIGLQMLTSRSPPGLSKEAGPPSGASPPLRRELFLPAALVSSPPELEKGIRKRQRGSRHPPGRA